MNDPRELVEALSNWGRWGAEDERGTLNLIGPEQVLAAGRLVREGRAVGLARPIDPAVPDVYGAPQRLLLAGGAGPRPERPPHHPDVHHSHVEYVGLAFHGLTVTHLDAPSHVAHDGRLYNGFPASSVGFATGATACAVTAALPTVVTRGVLLDVPRLLGVDRLEPGAAVEPDLVERCLASQGTTIGPGDAVVLHTGGESVVPGAEDPGRAGFHWTVLPWLVERDVAVVASDGISDAVPNALADHGFPLPFHVLGLVHLGLWLVDNCAKSELAVVCAELGRWEFALHLTPLALVGATGSPVTPVALF